jgi:hypothetical protein
LNAIFGATAMRVETSFAGRDSKTGISRCSRSSPISEQKRLEFRADFFNAFNHYDPEFDSSSSFNTNIATEHGLDEPPPVGQPLNALTGCPNSNSNNNCAWGFAQAAHDPRFIEFALKFYF